MKELQLLKLGFLIMLLFGASTVFSQTTAKVSTTKVTNLEIATPFDQEYLDLTFQKGIIKKVNEPIDLIISDAFIAGADYLQHAQADITEDNAGNGNPDVPDDPDDGGWDWVSTIFTHLTSASPTNIYGATAQGLYYAYLESGDAGYFTALQDAATVMIGNADIRSGSDMVFLMNFQDIAGVTADIYQDAAKAKFDARITTYGSATALAEYIRDIRAGQGYENGIIGWDIGIYAVIAQMLENRYPTDPYDYAQASDDIAEVLYQDSFNNTPGYFDIIDDQGWDPTYTDKNFWWYSLGITGLIDAFNASGSHTNELPGLLTILSDCRYTGGAFSGSYGANTNDEDWQSTAYSVLSLASYNQATYQEDINHACFWIGSTQDAASGGWVYGSGNHYPEIGGECTAALYFGENPTEVWVDDDYTSSSSGGHLWGYDAFDNIQDGIDAVVGSTVNVAAGTYREQLYIDKSLDLVGAGELTTTIEAPDPIDRTTYTTTSWTGTTKTIDAIIGVKDAGTVNISGFKVDGRDTGPSNYYGIHYFNTGGLITQNTIEKITYPAVPGAQAVLCLVASHGLGKTYDIDIIDNYIPGFQKGGIALKGPGCTFTVNDNNVIGSSTPNIAGNCIQLSYGASGTTSGNIVEGVVYTGADWAATGILLFESGDISMDGDEVFNCQSGVNFSDWGWGYTNPNPVNLTFTNLNLHDNEWTFASQQSRDGSDVNITMTDCDILDNGGDGIEFYGTDAWGSYYTGWDNGSLTASITGCTITNSLYDGIWVADFSGNTTNTFDIEVHGCTFTGNTQSAINNTVSQIIDAENNYWGDDSGPSVGAKSFNMRPISKMVMPNEMTVKEYKQLFTNSADPVKGSGQTILGPVDYAPWCNSSFTFCNYGGAGPVTTIPTLTEQCYNSTISVPVTVTNFNNIGGISLLMDYDDAVLNLSSVTWNNAISGGQHLIPIPGKITFSWISTTGVNIVDNEPLFTLEFTYIGSEPCPSPAATALTWNNSDPAYLEYSTPDGVVFDDDPYATYYINGSIEIKDITNPVITFLPSDITDAEVNESTNPSETGFATATDNCSTVEVTFADAWAAGSCVGTGIITRTWTATDACGNTATGDQTITVLDTYTPTITCPGNISVSNDPGVCEAVVNFDVPESLDPGYNEGWESANFVMGTYGGWSPYNNAGSSNSELASVVSGTDGIISSDGARHGLIESDYSGNTGIFGRLGAYNISFCNGFHSSVDIYMDLSDSRVLSGVNADYAWDLTLAANGQDGNHQRDFIFQTASNTSGQILVGVNNGSNHPNPNPNIGAGNHYAITSTGWYTFDWVFYDDGGILAVDLTILDNTGTELWSETLSSTLDVIATEVGGNRYLWFTFLKVEKLAIDNVTIERNTDVVPDYASGYTFPVGTTTVTVTSSDCCSNTEDCTFEVEVTDDELPTITCPTVDPYYLVNDVCTWVASGLEPVINDNCATPDLYYSVDGGTTWVNGDANGYAFPIGSTNVIYKTIDQALNESTTCSFTINVDGVTVTGTIEYYNGANTPMNGVTVTLQGTSYSTVTDAAGTYTFTDVCLGTYSVEFATTKDNGGINSTDAAQVNYWGVNSSTIEKVRFNAGDVNGGSNVNGADAGLIQQYFLTLGNPTPSFASVWEFWTMGETISSNPPMPTSQYPTMYVTGSASAMTMDFYAMVTGDFNRSFTPAAKGTASETLTLNYGEVLEVGSTEFELPLYAGTDMKVGAISLILNIPSDILEVQGVYIGSDPNTPLLYSVAGDELRISWQSLTPVSLKAGDPMLTLKLGLNGLAGEEGIMLSLAADPLNELANNNFEVINNAVLVVDIIHTTILGINGFSSSDELVLASHPNPFKQTTNFVYSLPIDGKVTLEIFDIVGNKVKTVVDEVQNIGEHQFKFDANMLQPGVYMAILRVQNSKTVLTRTIKIISKQ